MSGIADKSAKREAIVPRGWTDFYQATGIPAAVRAGGLLRLTGHTGDMEDGTFAEDPEKQTRQTFHNISQTLHAAGADWSDVIEITSYRVGLRAQAEVILAVAAEFLERPYPAWTDVGVTELFESDAVVEISCVAMVPSGSD